MVPILGSLDLVVGDHAQIKPSWVLQDLAFPRMAIPSREAFRELDLADEGDVVQVIDWDVVNRLVSRVGNVDTDAMSIGCPVVGLARDSLDHATVNIAGIVVGGIEFRFCHRSDPSVGAGGTESARWLRVRRIDSIFQQVMTPAVPATSMIPDQASWRNPNHLATRISL